MNPYKRHPVIIIATILVYIFLYAPIVVLILYSFNASRANVTFEGFIPDFSERVEMQGSLVKASPCGPFHWFCELSKNRDVTEAARQYADDCVHLHDHFHDYWYDGCAGASAL